MSTPSQDTDRLLRQKLAQVPVPAPSPAGWARLAQALDQDVDHGLRAALTGLADERTADGWDRLERKLDPQAAADAATAAALNGLQPPPPAGDWKILERRLDETLGAEVDSIVQYQLKKDAGQTSGWAALAARLELISHRRQLVGAWKVVEFGLLTSLMLLLLRFGPGNPEGRDIFAGLRQSFPMETTRPAPLPAAVNIFPDEGKDSGAEKPAPVAATAPVAARRRGANKPAARTAGTVAPLPVPAYRAELTEREVPSVAAVADPLSGPAYTARWASTLPSPALELPAIDNSVPVRYHLNLFVSPTEINEVITPASRVGGLAIKGRSKFTHSVSAGALLDISKGNDGLQVGAIYGRHAYVPAELSQQDCFVTGTCTPGFNRFEYHSISFPFSYERSLFHRNDWRVATRVGMSMSVITRSEFEEPADAPVSVQQALEAERPAGRGPSPPPTGNTINSRNLISPDPGWFEGGGLLVNASFYLGGGFTVERTLNHRVSLYVSPSYGRVIYLSEEAGVGPYNDRIHRASVRFGSRFLLNRR